MCVRVRMSCVCVRAHAVVHTLLHTFAHTITHIFIHTYTQTRMHARAQVYIRAHTGEHMLVLQFSVERVRVSTSVRTHVWHGAHSCSTSSTFAPMRVAQKMTPGRQQRPSGSGL